MQLKCNVCGLRLSIYDFSKQSRKLDEPSCKRCTAWTETQEHEVVPAPLATGHVSLEERVLDPRATTAITSEDYADCETFARRVPVTELEGLDLEGDELQRELEAAFKSRDPTSYAPSTSAGSQVPRHLHDRINAAVSLTSPSESRDDSSVTSMAASSNAQLSAAHAKLPPHLRDKVPAPPSSVSTATTVRDTKEAAKKERQIEFTAYAPNGIPRQRAWVPPTEASSTLSEMSSRRTDSDAQSVEPRRAGRRGWPVSKAAPFTATRQIERNPIAVIGLTQPDVTERQQQYLGFCNDDSD